MVTYNGSLLTLNNSVLRNGVGPRTIRFLFNDASYDPTTGSWAQDATWEQVSVDPNIWDYHRDTTNWRYNFQHKFGRSYGWVEILDANLEGVTDAQSLFLDCSGLLRVNKLRNTESNTAWHDFFYLCKNLEYVDKFEVGTVTDFYGGDELFCECFALQEIPAIDFSKLKRGVRIFSSCRSITRLPSTFTTANWSAGYGMFAGCSSLLEIPNTLDTSKMNYLASMFSGCSSLTSIPFVSTESLSRSSGYNNLVHSMFDGCSSLLQLPTNFDTTNAKGIEKLCRGCTSLTAIPSLNTAYLSDVSSAFSGCTGVENGALALYNQMIAQTNPPTTYTDCFTDCGSGNPSGLAELQQIPTSWGGLLEDNYGLEGN